MISLAKAQKIIPNPEKNKTVKIQTKSGREFEFDYADLGALKEVSREPLAENGLSIVHRVLRTGDYLDLVTTLIHDSGQFLSSAFPLSGKMDMKEVGAEITYAKRYNKAAILDMFAEDDNDVASAK